MIKRDEEFREQERGLANAMRRNPTISVSGIGAIVSKPYADLIIRSAIINRIKQAELIERTRYEVEKISGKYGC